MSYVKKGNMFKARINWKEEIPKLKELGSMGIGMAGLARRYDVSRQRMKQIVDKFIPDWGYTYGQTVQRNQVEEHRFQKWGIREDSELYDRKKAKFRNKKAQAKQVGWEWGLEFGDVVWPTHCPILGMELDYFTETIAENSVSFDQIVAGKGYIKGNVHIISWRANRIKNNGTAKEHRMIADYLDSIA